MSDDWKKGYTRAVFRALCKRAGVIGEPHYFPGDDVDYKLTQEFQDHMKRCAVNVGLSTLPEDSEWTQWGGTFGTDYQVHGLDATITCMCWKYKNVKVRMTGNFGQLLRAVLDEE